MPTSQEVSKYSTAKSFLRVQGILSIIFGSLGTLVGLPLILLYVFSLSFSSIQYSYDGGDWFAVIFLIIIGLIFWILPHIYMIIAGTYLVRKPKPGLAKGLTIGNLVIGALLNYILLAFAIVSLVQSSHYEEGYKRN
jgi:amino acid transporter